MSFSKIIIFALLALTLGCGNSGGSGSPTDGGGGEDTGSESECTASSDCEDDNPCTDDICNLGVCENTFNTNPCDDEDICTENDTCQDGECVGATLDCDDDNACTDDSCDSVDGCVNDNNTSVCDDENECTLNDTCQEGLCQGGGAVDCNDDNICTDDSCDPSSGCVNDNNTDPCDDGQYCSIGDECLNGVCVGTGTYNCDDGNPCTEDNCDDVAGCQYTNNTAPCDDADACTVGDVCGGGSCQPGAPPDCDDLDVCTDDSCDTFLGCQNVFNTAPCDDSDACTMNDECYGGACGGVPMDFDGDTYISDACGGDDCDDNDEFVHPLIFEGPMGDIICADTVDNDCDGYTDDLDTGCMECIVPSDCDDFNVCNGTEDCVSGTCVPGTVLDCDDSDICTDDSCVPATGCAYVDNTDPCNDADACTLGDFCIAGSCTGSTGTLGCDDGNLCTDDSCLPATGCDNAFNTVACDDLDACTVGDQCQDGSCVSGPIQDLDGDGYGDGTGACTGNDCDDSDDTIYPGAVELCDLADNNCNGLVDEGCPICDTVDPAAQLVIDNDAPYSGYSLVDGDEVMNVFFIDVEAYNVLDVQVAFYDFCAVDPSCTGGTGNGQFALHIYENDSATGLPGAELASTGAVTVATNYPDFYTFSLSEPLSLVQGEIIWVGIESIDDQSANLYLPLFDGGILVPYQGGALYSFTDTTYYGTFGNWLIRVDGCAEGPWISLESHVEVPAVVPAGGTATTTATIANKEFGDAADVTGVLSSNNPDVTVTATTSAFGPMLAISSSTGTPSFQIDTAPLAYGIYPVYLESTDGPNNWFDAWGVYVQGLGCGIENHQLIVDSGNAVSYMAPSTDDMVGNYYVVDATSFSLTSVEAQFYRNTGPPSADFMLKVYTYRAGFPDQLIFPISVAEQAAATVNVSGTGVINEVVTLPTPLTFKEGDTFWVVLESLDDLSAVEFGPLIDDEDTAAGSWVNGVLWEDATSAWYPFYASFMIRPTGCRATELLYDSYTSTPDPILKGASATLDITVLNDGALDAIGVTGVLSSTHPEVTVTQPNGNFGTVTAAGTATAVGFGIDVAAGATEFQYLLDLQLTDGVTIWDTFVPVQLDGGEINLLVENLTSTLVGDQIRFNFDVSNTGNIDCFTGFAIDLYYDENTAPSIGDTGDWSITRSGLNTGATVSYQHFTAANTGNYDTYAQVDTLAAVTETDEVDNLMGPENLVVGATDVFVLLSPARKWFPIDTPVEYRFVTGNTQTGMPAGEDRTATQNGFQHWDDVATATISFTQIPDSGSALGFINDGYNTMSFDDPDGDLGTGTLAAALPIYSGMSMVTNGTTFYRLTDADIVFNNAVNFATNADTSLPSCTNYYDMEGVATHEIGHLLGLDHPDVWEATMFWSMSPCDDSKNTLEQSDINGVTFIYPL